MTPLKAKFPSLSFPEKVDSFYLISDPFRKLDKNPKIK